MRVQLIREGDLKDPTDGEHLCGERVETQMNWNMNQEIGVWNSLIQD